MTDPAPAPFASDPSTARLLAVIERQAGLARAGLESRVNRHFPPEQRAAVAERLAVLSWRDPDWQALVEPLLVHETFLFRDWAQLRHLRAVGLAERLAQPGARRLTIWSAGCSSGEEAYSLAALATTALDGKPGWTVRVVGSDLSRAMVHRAARATFRLGQLSAFRAMPSEFEALFPGAGPEFRTVRADLRDQVRFAADNLLDGPAPVTAADVVACRNVLIYMAGWARSAALQRLAGAVAPGGFLLLGPTDQPPPPAQFEPIWGEGAVIYRRLAA